MRRQSMQTIQSFTRWITRQSERGASLVEYALLVALIAVVMVGAVTLLGEGTSATLDRSNSSIIDATS
jgi:pilus assembly protein Flp/PilA